MADRPTEHQLVFVAGLHRSGTTPLARCLAAHPRASGFADTGVPADEGQHLQDVYPQDISYGGPGLFGYHEPGHLTEDSELVSAAHAARLFEQWSMYWDLDCPVLIEKSPPNLIRSRFLRALFPGCRFVFIQRHPVVASLATRKMSGINSVPEMVAHWVHCHQLFLEDVAHLEPQTYRAVRYERLVADPQPHIDRIMQWLGLDPMPVAEMFEPRANEPYLRAYADMRRSWLSRRGMRKMIAELEPGVRALGYSLDEVDRLLPSPVFDP